MKVLDTSLTSSPRISMSFIVILASLEMTVPIGRLITEHSDSLFRDFESHLIWWKDPKKVLVASPGSVTQSDVLY